MLCSKLLLYRTELFIFSVADMPAATDMAVKKLEIEYKNQFP